MLTRAIPQHTVDTTDHSFSSLGLSAPILAALEELGFRHPTPIQAEVIPRLLAGRDVIGLAQTGSGKTAAFALPMAEKLWHGKGVRGLIVCPTREIALQTQAFLEVFGRDHQLATTCIIGGVNYGPQIRELGERPDIVVATPGRLLDHMERGNVRLDAIEILVLDEADHMLDLGFLPQMRRILESVPAQRQTMMFSATMVPPIERLAQRFMRDPERVDILPSGRAAEGIEHRLYMVHDEDKKKCLMALIEEEPGAALVFVRRKIDAEWACRQLELQGHPVERIHSDRSQRQRVEALSGIREGEHRILVATDIAARGIDLPILEHIINFDVPQTVEDYIHRAGRTARGLAGGTVSTIATWQDKEMIRGIEKAIEQPLLRRVAPGVEPYVERSAAGRGGRERVRRRLR
ncbi:MAG TPA: DEAD/DEAH box helicase [Thermoanaerobaculia bacterium]|nr:DEAD/DEAH box helicase [Thermoanaerobaculia bacterium]